jgi:1,4-dihydroxy-2-naphthoate octaprenyltransferase
MRSLAAFVELSRPKFLVAGVAGFALGAAVAAYEGADLNPLRYAAGQFMVTAFQLMTHFANDFFDRENDRLGTPSEFAGGSGVLVRGALAPCDALRAALACAGAGALVATAFAAAGFGTAAALGAAMGIGAWSYSAPPLRLAARGWGEAVAAVVVAVLVPLTGYTVFTSSVDELAIAATLGPACALFAMLLAVEWPDRAADVAGGKANLVVRLGLGGAGQVAKAAALLVVPALLVALAAGAPRTEAVFAIVLVPAVAAFVRGLSGPERTPTEVAARGVTLFLVTAVFALLGYLSALR